MTRCSRAKALLAAAVSSTTFLIASNAQLSKVDRILQQDGFQLQAASESGGTFYFNGHVVNSQQVNGYTQANYTAPSWAGQATFTDSNGVPITGPWAIWNVGPGTEPDQVPADQPYLSNLVGMALGDEQNWESDSSVQANLVSEFQQAQANPVYNNTIVYTNNFIGQTQLDGPGVSNFIQQAHPDMLTFDWYPFTTNNAATSDDSQILNTPFDSWYTELRFYRDVALDNSYQPSNPNYSVDIGIYRQTYSTDDGTRTPNTTEYALETNTAIAFNAKQEMDFLYNGSASKLFTDGNQTGTTALYTAVQRVNHRAQNLGNAMTHLTPLIANPDLNWATGTPDILMLRGQQVSGNTTTPNQLPNGFQPNSVNGSLNSSWTAGANDPWMTGFGQANIGNTVNGFINASGKQQFATGDALISWFRPLGESQAAATAKSDLYFLLVNALSTPTATPDQCLQDIHMDFTTWPLAQGQTIPSIQYLDQDTGQIVTLFEDQTGMAVTNSTIEPAGTVLLTNTSGKDNNPSGTKLRLNVFLDGGDSFLFRFNTGTPFLVPEPTGLTLLVGAAALMLKRPRSAALA